MLLEKESVVSPPFSPSKKKPKPTSDLSRIYSVQAAFSFLFNCPYPHEPFLLITFNSCWLMLPHSDAQTPAVNSLSQPHHLGLPAHGLGNQTLTPSQLSVLKLPYKPSGYLPLTYLAALVRWLSFQIAALHPFLLVLSSQFLASKATSSPSELAPLTQDALP